MYTAPTQRREPLPALQPPRSSEDGAGAGDTRLGKAWSPPASLNGTLTRTPPTLASVSAERHFALSSSLPRAAAAAAAAPKSSRQSVTPPRTAYGASLAATPAAPPLVRAPLMTGPTTATIMNSTTTTTRTLEAATEETAEGNGGGRRPAPGVRAERIAEVEAFLTRYASARTPEPQRNSNVRAALEDVVRVYPSLASVMVHVSRYVRDLGAAAQSTQADHATALVAQEQALYERFESFFEKKIAVILADKARLEDTVQQLHAENFSLRQDRDGELAELKADLMHRLNECEKREDEFRSFRQLIAAVYKTNGQLTNRVDDLESLLAKHRIEVPPAVDELFLYSRSRGGGGPVPTPDSGVGATSAAAGGGGGAGDDGRHSRRDGSVGRSGALAPAFLAASRAEMNLARLTLQQELLHCAFDDRSAYRLQIAGLRTENNNLQYQASTLAATVESLNRYIHEKRFLAVTYDDDGNVVRPLTPRPQDVPFGIETELGVDLKGSTAEIVSELAAVATNLKHQLNSALLRLRQATTVSEWMGEQTFIELDQARNGDAGVLPTFPVSAWPTIPHFLRTKVSPDVENMRWTGSDIGAILYTFFTNFRDLRAACRYVRDGKMVAPRTYQQFERREVVLTRLDATKEELRSDDGEANVPFGYVVTHFIHELLMHMAPCSKEARFALPGTLHPRFTVRNEVRPVELECTRFAYNIWWAAQRHRHTQPLCRLFLDVVDGRLAPEIFDVMERVVTASLRHVRQQVDVDGSHLLPYLRLVSSTTRLVSDLGAHAARCAVLAVAQTFEENQVPIVGGRLRYDALAADESHCIDEARLGVDDVGVTSAAGGGGHLSPLRGGGGAGSGLPPLITARRVPCWRQQPLGASVLTRYWRRLVIERYAAVYAFVERAMAPLVMESDVVLGLYLLPIPEAAARATAFDSDSDARAADSAAPAGVFFPSDSALPVAATTATSEAFEAATEGVPAVTRSYATLLSHRRDALHARQVEERVRLAQLVHELLDTLPRLHRSVHFPFAAKSGGGGGGGGRGGSGGAAKGKGVRSPSPAVPTTATTSNATAPGAADGAGAEAKKQKKPRAAKPPKRPGALGADTATAATAAESRGGAGKRGEGQRPRSRRHRAAVPEDMMNLPDNELVEWFGFCFALRQRVLPLPEMIFQSEFLDGRGPSAKAGGPTSTPTGAATAGSGEVVGSAAEDRPTTRGGGGGGGGGGDVQATDPAAEEGAGPREVSVGGASEGAADASGEATA